MGSFLNLLVIPRMATILTFKIPPSLSTGDRPITLIAYFQPPKLDAEDADEEVFIITELPGFRISAHERLQMDIREPLVVGSDFLASHVQRSHPPKVPHYAKDNPCLLAS
jgi:hypothetical protein